MRKTLGHKGLYRPKKSATERGIILTALGDLVPHLAKMHLPRCLGGLPLGHQQQGVAAA